MQSNARSLERARAPPRWSRPPSILDVLASPISSMIASAAACSSSSTTSRRRTLRSRKLPRSLERVVERVVLDRLLEEATAPARSASCAPFSAPRRRAPGCGACRGWCLRWSSTAQPSMPGSAHVEHDRVGLVLVREREARVAAERDDALEAALARHLEHRRRERRVVLDDQHDAVAGVDRARGRRRRSARRSSERRVDDVRSARRARGRSARARRRARRLGVVATRAR